MSEAMGENEFRKTVYHKYHVHFDHLYSLHQFAEEATAGYKGKAATAHDTALWLILARAFKSFDSVRRLCEVALCEDAAVVLRSLLSLLAITRWISTDPQKRAARYLGWYWIAIHEEANRPGTAIPTAWMQEINKHYNAAIRLFQYTDTQGKVRMAEKWHQPEASSIRDLFEQTELGQQYDEAYKPLSGIEHSDATAYMGMLLEMEKGGEERSLAVHADSFIPALLRNAFQYFADIFAICNAQLAVTDTKEFQRIREEGIRFYATDLRHEEQAIRDRAHKAGPQSA